MYSVPHRTYILHVAPAGKACRKVQWFFDNWIYQYEKAPAPGTKSIKQKLLDSLRNKTFLRTADANMRQYLGSLESSNVANLTNLSLNFYEPGDIVSDLTLTMFNHNMPLFLQGLYEIPIPYTLKQQQFAINKKTKFFSNNAEINAMNISNLNVGTLPTPAELDEYHQLYNTPANLLQAKMYTENRRTFTVHELLTLLGPVPAGQSRLLIVDACRVATTEAVAKRARRMSLAVRRKPLGTNVRPWLNIGWLRATIKEYIDWVKANVKLADRAPYDAFKKLLVDLFTDLNANKVVSRETLFMALQGIQTTTKALPELAGLLEF